MLRCLGQFKENVLSFTLTIICQSVKGSVWDESVVSSCEYELRIVKAFTARAETDALPNVRVSTQASNILYNWFSFNLGRL